MLFSDILSRVDDDNSYRGYPFREERIRRVRNAYMQFQSNLIHGSRRKHTIDQSIGSKYATSRGLFTYKKICTAKRWRGINKEILYFELSEHIHNSDIHLLKSGTVRRLSTTPATTKRTIHLPIITIIPITNSTACL